MTEKEPTGKVEVAHITGVQGIRAAMEVLAREAAGEGETDVPLLGERRLTHFFARRDARGGSARTPHLCFVRCRQRWLSGDLLELRHLAAPGALALDARVLFCRSRRSAGCRRVVFPTC